MKARIFTGAAIAGLLASPAMAADWQVMENQDAASPQAIYSVSETTADVVFTCNDTGKLKMLIGLDDTPITEQLAKRVTYARAETMELARGDAAASEYRVRWVPNLGIAQVVGHNAAAKVYNAAVTGETIRFEVKRQDPVEMTLPEVNDAFSAFASTCSALRAEAT